MTFAERLEELYVKHGYDQYPQRVAAYEMVITETSLRAYLAGKSEPSMGIQRSIAKAFKITIAELLEGVE